MDKNKIKQFWDKCPDICNENPLLITTLSFEIPYHATYRDKTEKNIFFRIIKLNPDYVIADLGCGTGRWTLEFARRCKKVIASDISQRLLDIARSEAAKRQLENIEFKQESIADFKLSEPVDVIHIGGVLIYVNDTVFQNIIQKCHETLKEHGTLILRESISLTDDILVKDLIVGNEKYSAYYRTLDHFMSMVKKYFTFENTCETHSYVFPVPVYLYLVPKFLKKTKFIENILEVLYEIQWRLDPYFLNIKILTSLKHCRLKKTGLPVSQYFLVCRKKT
jgi:2-polyprenyl-3-methyl-5-hydroxy-6-metoxy-1,4-benzoquinol methylase